MLYTGSVLFTASSLSDLEIEDTDLEMLCLRPRLTLYRVEERHRSDPLLIHNASLTLCLLSATQTGTS